jgi:hypothetical protein
MVDGRHLRRCRDKMLKRNLFKSRVFQSARYIIFVLRLTHKSVLRSLSRCGWLKSKAINRGMSSLCELAHRAAKPSPHHRWIVNLNYMPIYYFSYEPIRIRSEVGVRQDVSVPTIFSKRRLATGTFSRSGGKITSDMCLRIQQSNGMATQAQCLSAQITITSSTQWFSRNITNEKT